MKSFYVCPSDEDLTYPSCFICGFKRSGAYTVSLRQSGQPGPYFPFLETHDPPEGAEQPTSDGKVLSCYTCYAFLLQQWESYERDKVPPVKRIYWLKRVDDGPYTGVELGMQSEYASQVFGLTSDHSNQGDPQKNYDNGSPRALHSFPVKKDELEVPFVEPETSSVDSQLHDDSPEQHEALDLSMERRGKKRELEVCETTDDCSQVLDLSLPDQDTGTEACYICGIQVSAETLHSIYAITTPSYIEGPHFENIQFHPRASGSVPIKRNGTISACLSCTSRLFSLWNIYQKQKVLHPKRNYFIKIPSSDFEELKCCKCLSQLDSTYRPQLDHNVKMGPNPLENALIVELAFMCKHCQEISLEIIGWKKSDYKSSGVSIFEEMNQDISLCSFCKKILLIKQMHTLSFIPVSGKPFYFPNNYDFVPVEKTITQDGRILACSPCFSSILSKIWEKPGFPVGLSSLSYNKNYLNQPPSLSKSVDLTEERTLCKSLYPKYDDGAVINDDHLTALTTQMALNRAAICYFCGHYSKSGETYAMTSKKIGSEPFFPFLSKYPSLHKESIVDNFNFLVCQFCFHSLIAQWQMFEKQAPNPHLRVYDTHSYVCFVCSTKTYRKRLHIMHVKDFPFLKEHSPPSGAMIINNGHSVIVCKDCFTSLSDQYTELERVGVPVEKRQYNWIQRPPPPEFENSSGSEMLKAKGLSHGWQSIISTPSTSSIEAKPSPLNREIHSKGRLSPSVVPPSMVKDKTSGEGANSARDISPLDVSCKQITPDASPTSASHEGRDCSSFISDSLPRTPSKIETEANS